MSHPLIKNYNKNIISMNDDANIVHKYFAAFLLSNNQWDVSTATEF